MGGILIVKLGALGDVLRTTPLLRRLPGRVTWVTARRALPLLRGNPLLARAVAVEDSGRLAAGKFDWVINFDEDPAACALAGRVRSGRRTGAFLRNGMLTYCADSAPWFDMSLVSRLGRAAADRLKRANRRSYQHFLFSACGFRFAGEEYLLPEEPSRPARPLVALEAGTGARWPLKRWPGYRELSSLLERRGVEVFFLRRRRELSDYVRDINRCSLLVSGDTLAMHVALGLRKKAVAVFNCTSPAEIYGYARLRKVLHPRLAEVFYSSRKPAPGFRHIRPGVVLREVLPLVSSTT